jgi:hypothetical protein
MFGREPVLILGLVRAIVVLVVAFGFDLSADQVAGIYLVAEAILSVLNRTVVSPVEPARRRK